MSKRNARFNKLGDDSKVFGIGSLFRGVGNKSWAINVEFNGNNEQSLQFSNIPVLARKRILNATKPHKVAGLPVSFIIENAQTWGVAKASKCPAYRAHSHGKDGDQLCFVAQAGDKKVYIPQLEMARSLFYHDPYLARLSLQHNALNEDFILGKREDGQPVIVVREGAEYPVSYFNRDDNRRFLSWVLLDSNARKAFESISSLLIKSQTQKNNYHHWVYQFMPPPMDGVRIRAKGWEDTKSKSFFVWEITQLKNLPSDVEGEIDFYHPAYVRKIGGKPTKGDGKQGKAPEEFDLDDDEIAGSDKATMELVSEQVIVSFANGHITNRIASKTKPVNNMTGGGETEVLDKDLSPNEKEESGSLAGGAWNNLEDQTDDAHLYLGKFDSFFKMVNVLCVKHQFKQIRTNISKLPKINEGKKHWLADTQNPRCMATVELRHKGNSFTLLEVDTSDGTAKLSTMLLTSVPGWVAENETTVLSRIMKKSLGWPTELFSAQLGEGAYTGIPHPKSKHSGGLPPEVIGPWAQRIANWVKRS